MVHPRGVPADERGKSISVTAEADRTYRGGLVPAKFVRDEWGRWDQMIFGIWQTEVNCMASNTRHQQRWRHVLVRQQQSQQQSSGEPHLKAGGSSAGVFLLDVARALRHGLLIPVMLSGILVVVAMEWWECCLVCACGVVIGWEARGVLQAEAFGSKTEPPQQRMGKRNWSKERDEVMTEGPAQSTAPRPSGFWHDWARRVTSRAGTTAVRTLLGRLLVRVE